MPRVTTYPCSVCGRRVNLHKGPAGAHSIVFAPHHSEASGPKYHCAGTGKEWHPKTPAQAEHPPKPRGVGALLATTAFCFEIEATDAGRVEIALEGLQIVLSAHQALSVATGFRSTAKFGPAGDTVTVLIRPGVELTVPRNAVDEVAKRLHAAAEKASQCHPEGC